MLPTVGDGLPSRVDPSQSPNPDTKNLKTLMGDLLARGLEQCEVLQVVNLMPDNAPLLSCCIAEVDGRFEGGEIEEMLSVIKEYSKEGT